MTQQTVAEPPTARAEPPAARSFTEYLALFGVSGADLHGRRVLDAHAGASAFTAGALARGLDAVATDRAYPPLPGPDRPAALAELGLRAVAEADRRHVDVLAAGPVSWGYFKDPEDLRRRRLAAARFFAAHAAEHPDRYVPSPGPALPFADASFDLVLCTRPVTGPELQELRRVGHAVRVLLTPAELAYALDPAAAEVLT